MAEPTTTSVAGWTILSFSVAGALVGYHPAAIWGALIGSIICIMTYPEIHQLKKIIYLFLSWFFGYYISLEFINQGFVKTEGAVACLASALCLPLVFYIIKIIKSGELIKAIKSIFHKD